MNICILGNGKLGYAVAGKLSADGHNTTVIDLLPEALRPSELKQDVITVLGDALDRDVLKDAGVPEADLVIATMGSGAVGQFAAARASLDGSGWI